MSLRTYIKKIPFISSLLQRIYRASQFLDWRGFLLTLFKREIETHPVHRTFLPRVCRKIVKDQDFIVCDVGANQGLFVQRILKHCPQVKIHAFEPQRSCHPVLEAITSKHPNVVLHKAGIGSAKGTLIFNELSNHGLSSFRTLHHDYSYGDKGIGENANQSYEASVETLDELMLPFLENKSILLKIDTQGFEKEVLVGAKKLLEQQKISCIILEMMTLEKYEGQATWLELLDLLNQNQFVLYDLLPGHREPKSEMLTEFDAVFIHRSFARSFLAHHRP